MNKDGIRNLLERMLESHPDDITDNNDRKVWISDVADVFYKIANTDLNNPDELRAGGKYLVTKINWGGGHWSSGMMEITCVEVTQKAYKLREGGKERWVPKNTSIEILEVLNEPNIDPKFCATASTFTFSEIRNDADIGWGYGDNKDTQDLPF